MFDNPYLKVIKKTGPHGDCTCWYDITVPEGWTLRDFIQYVCHDYAVQHKEWGTIRKQPFAGYDDHIVEYDGKKGSAWLYGGEQYFSPEDKEKSLANSKALYDKCIDKEIIGVRANGGWGNMDYLLDFGPEPKSYAGYEF